MGRKTPAPLFRAECHGAELDQCRCYLMFADASRCLLKLRAAASNLYKDPGDLGPKCGRCQLRQPQGYLQRRTTVWGILWGIYTLPPVIFWIYPRISYFPGSGGNSMATVNTACCSWSGASGHSDYKAQIPTPTGHILWPIDYPPRRICLLLMCASHTLVGQGPPHGSSLRRLFRSAAAV